MTSGEVDTLAGRLSISGEGLKRLRRQYRMDHGEEAEAKLLAWLKATWEQQRDRVQRMAKGSGYTEHWSKSMGASRRSQLGNLHHEPEAVPDQTADDYARNGWQTMEAVKGEEQARREAASRAQRMRQAELDLRKAGRSHEQHAATIDRAIEAMRQEAVASGTDRTGSDRHDA